MARRADGRLRPTTKNVAGAGDAVDAGWDEVSTHVTIRPESAPITTAPPPASMSRKVGALLTPSPSLPPVSSVPRPKPSGRAPRALSAPPSWMERATQLQQELGVTGRPNRNVRAEPTPVRSGPAPVGEEPTLVREEPTLVREEPTLVREEPTLVREEPTLVQEEPTVEFSTEFVDEADIGPAEGTVAEPLPNLGSEVAEQVRDDELFEEYPRGTPPVPTSPLRVSELDIPDFRRHQLGPATVIAAMGAAIALVVASVASNQFPNRAEPTVETRTLRPAKEPIQQPPSEARSPAPASSPITPVDVGVNTRAPLQQAAVATSLEKGSNAVAVTVVVIPAGAVIFRAGQKLGTGAVQVSVEHNAKQRLTALHDGYAPYNFTLDGSRETVTVRLKRVPRLEAAPAPSSDSPFEGPSENSNAE